MVLTVSLVILALGLGLILYGYRSNSDGAIFGGGGIIALAIIWGLWIAGTNVPTSRQVTKILPEQVEILRSPTAVHVRTTDGQLSRTYTELVHYNAITDTTTFYQVEQFNSYGSRVNQYIKY